MCDGMNPLGIPFEKEELEAFLKGLESVNVRLESELRPVEVAAIMGTRELLQELIHRLHHEGLADHAHDSAAADGHTHSHGGHHHSHDHA